MFEHFIDGKKDSPDFLLDKSLKAFELDQANSITFAALGKIEISRIIPASSSSTKFQLEKEFKFCSLKVAPELVHKLFVRLMGDKWKSTTEKSGLLTNNNRLIGWSLITDKNNAMHLHLISYPQPPLMARSPEEIASSIIDKLDSGKIASVKIRITRNYCFVAYQLTNGLLERETPSKATAEEVLQKIRIHCNVPAELKCSGHTLVRSESREFLAKASRCDFFVTQLPEEKNTPEVTADIASEGTPTEASLITMEQNVAACLRDAGFHSWNNQHEGAQVNNKKNSVDIDKIVSTELANELIELLKANFSDLSIKLIPPSKDRKQCSIRITNKPPDKPKDKKKA